MLKACISYFSLFLKDKCISSLFRTNYIGKKFNLVFFLLTVSWRFSPGLPRAVRPLKTSCLEKITLCVIETMLMTLPLVQMNKARREVNQTNQIQTKINRSSNVCYTLNPMPLNIKSNEIFSKIFWSKHFPATTNCRSFVGVSCETCSENSINFPEEHSQ